MARAAPSKGKAKVKVTATGKRVSYGQAGKAKGGGPVCDLAHRRATATALGQPVR